MDASATYSIDLQLTHSEERIFRTLCAALEGHPDYVDSIRRHFDLLMLQLVKFVTVRTNDQSQFRPYLGAFPIGEAPEEVELQQDLFDWFSFIVLTSSVIRERPDVSAGRADIYISFGTVRFVIEVKRVLHDWETEIDAYVGQTSAYQQTDVRLGFLAALDLTHREAGDPHIESCFEARERYFSDGLGRWVIVCRVPGNREIPSALSRRKRGAKRPLAKRASGQKKTT